MDTIVETEPLPAETVLPGQKDEGLSPKARLLLVFLLTAGKTVPLPKAVDKAMGDQGPLSAEEYNLLKQELAAAGWIEEKALRLTPAGRSRALAMAQLDEMPAGMKWPALKERYLFPVEHRSAAEVSPEARLLLIRLLAAREDGAPTSATLIKQLNAVLPEPLSAEAFNAVRQELKQAGLIDAGTSLPTARGRQEGLALLGYGELPPEMSADALVDRYLHPVESKEIAAVSRPAQALLLRLLLAGKNTPNLAALNKQLAPAWGEPVSARGLKALEAELKRAGLVSAGSFVPTQAGRQAALSLVGWTDLPENIAWETLLDRYLFPVEPKEAAEVSRPRKCC